MAGKLNVLVLESERGAADGAIRDLVDAGHVVHRCHDPGAAAFPCRALTDHDCPVREGVVDVALTVRARPRSQPAPLEDGASCALERYVPLVVAGSALLNPFEEWATEVLERTDDLVAACVRAAAAPLPRHGRRAMAALGDVFGRHGVDPEPVAITVRRAPGGGLSVRVAGCGELDHAVKAMASVRIIGALREIDHHARGIDVSFD